jgi:hypothetical protein
MAMQQKTQRPVQFEITEQTRFAAAAWIHQARLRRDDYPFPSRLQSVHATHTYPFGVQTWTLPSTVFAGVA